MSTLTVTNISNGSVSTSTANVVNGCAKAWVNFDGTLASPGSGRANYNVSSITKNGTGDFTINFTSALSDANYVTVAMAQSTGGSNSAIFTEHASSSTTAPTLKSTTQVRMSLKNGTDNSSALDSYGMYAAFFR